MRREGRKEEREGGREGQPLLETLVKSQPNKYSYDSIR